MKEKPNGYLRFDHPILLCFPGINCLLAMTMEAVITNRLIVLVGGGGGGGGLWAKTMD